MYGALCSELVKSMQGTQYVICMKKLRFSSCPEAKVLGTRGHRVLLRHSPAFFLYYKEMYIGIRTSLENELWILTSATCTCKCNEILLLSARFTHYIIVIIIAQTSNSNYNEVVVSRCIN